MSTSEIWCNIDAEKWRSYSSLSPTLHKIKVKKIKLNKRKNKNKSKKAFRSFRSVRGARVIRILPRKGNWPSNHNTRTPSPDPRAGGARAQGQRAASPARLERSGQRVSVINQMCIYSPGEMLRKPHKRTWTRICMTIYEPIYNAVENKNITCV